jgi:hypothetical protein
MVAETADGASLTDVKQALVDHVTSGKLLDFAAAKSVDEAAMRTWDSTRTVQAAVLRDILLGRLAPNLDPHGLQLRGARITGQLDLENLTISVWVQLYDCLLDEGLVAHDATLPGLVLSGCRFEHSSQPPLAADRLTAAVLLLDRAVITAASETGAIRLRSAHLGLLDCTDATIRNRTGPALFADGLEVDQDIFLRGRFKAVGAGADGTVQLRGAHVGGQLDCTDATIRNRTGPALAAEGLEVDQDVFLRGRFKAVGGGEGGAVRLAAAHVGELICTGARMRNGTGSALDAWGLQVDRNIFLDGFKAIGAGADGAVRLAAAHVHGLLDCTGATMRNKAGPALMAEAFQVDQSIVLREFTAVGGGDVTLHLALAQIGGALVFAPARLEHTADPQGRLVLDGLTYAGLPREISSREWLRLLREGTPSYAAQPYQQFAGAQRAAGDDGEVRKVLMAQRKDQIDRGALSGRADRAWARLTGLTLGYGYRPWRALLALVAIATIAVVLALILGTHGGVAHTDRRPPVGSRCSVVERIGVGLDLGLPLIKTGVRDHCDTTATATGQILTVAGWGLQLLAWAFATLFVAGFTGIVRKT